jgi:phosphotransacetylase
MLGVETPRVAIVSALETIDPILPTTLDAAALCKMAERNQITGGIIDGPLAFDNVISKEAAQAKDIESKVAGEADIILVPNAEAGHLLAKQIEWLADGQAANILMGARVPIILPGRVDSQLSQIASCAMAVLVAHHRLETPQAL